jgi:hypothetical protein
MPERVNSPAPNQCPHRLPSANDMRKLMRCEDSFCLRGAAQFQPRAFLGGFRGNSYYQAAKYSRRQARPDREKKARAARFYEAAGKELRQTDAAGFRADLR